MKEERCNLCPRNCKGNRAQGDKGYCGQSSQLKVARAALHMWEEPCISGREGSGTVFFSGCALHCVFCQNQKIANGEVGKGISVERLAEIFLELQEKKANNINLVTPGQFAPQIAEALRMAKNQGLKISVLYNSSAYESLEALREMEGLVDIYLPDLKYVDSALSKRYSHAEDYFETAKVAIAEMVRQVGMPQFQDLQGNPMRAEEYNELEDPRDGRLVKGVIVRHLLMPGLLEDSKRVLDYLLTTYGTGIYCSIMNQFTPLPMLQQYPEINRRVTEEEYESLLDYAIARGIENAFIQEGETAEESFIPDFSCEGV